MIEINSNSSSSIT